MKRIRRKPRTAWHAIEQQTRRAMRFSMLRRCAGLYLCWLAAILCAIWETAVCFLAVEDLGSSWPFLVASALWAATLCWVVPDAWRHWQGHVARRLYFEDIADGVCPDRGMQITSENGWKWYRKQGSPWWVSSVRERPFVRPVDAITRLGAWPLSERKKP